MTLLQLRYFIETIHTGSTQKAAEKLNISQSAISVSIRSLEKELGLTLFNRTSRGLVLTEEGEELLKRGRAVLEQFDLMISDMEKYSAVRRQIRIGMPPLVSLSHWPDLFCCLNKAFPEGAFETVLETRLILLEMLKTNRIDLAIMNSRMPETDFSGLNYKFLSPDDQRSVIMSIENPLAVHQTLTYAELVHEPLLGYQKGDEKTKMLRKLYASYGVELHYIQECTQLSVLIELLKKNVGIAYLNERVIRDCEELVNIPISDAGDKGNFYLIYSRKISEKICCVVADYFKNIMKKPESVI